MDRYSLMFFAAPADLLDRLLCAEGHGALSYILVSYRSTDGTFPVWESAARIESLSQIDARSAIAGPRFLIGHAGMPWRRRNVKQVRGGSRYFVDQAENPDTVYLVTGGLHTQRALLAGTMSTIGNTDEGRALFDRFKMLFEDWQKVGEYFVGSEADRLARGGVRLVPQSILNPVERDLFLRNRNTE